MSGPGVREATDLIGLVSVSGRRGGGGSHRLALCQGGPSQGHAELERY